MGDPSTFTIEEQTGLKRRLELRGRALPYRPFTLKSKMRAEFTWYPGNPVATAQVLGAAEDATTITGMWKDRFIRNFSDENEPVSPTGVAIFDGQQVEDSMSLVAAVDSIRRAGQLVRVTWDEIVREGILTSFSHSWSRRERVNWEMEFSWISQGEKEQPVAFSKPSNATDFANDLSNKIYALNEAAVPTFNTVEKFINKLNGYLDTINAASQELSDQALQIANGVSDSTSIAQRTLATAVTVRDTAAEIVDLIVQTPSQSVRSVRPGGTLDYGELLETDVWTRGIKKNASVVRATAAEKSDELDNVVNKKDLLAVFVAQGPTDLRDVSNIYYGTPDDWRGLLDYNQLTSSELTPGQVVKVPKLQTVTGA